MSKLIEHDQLFNARIDVEQIDTCAARVRDGLVAFVGFRESDISFAPTFKVLRQAQTEYTTQRSPAYCDRVMWRSSPYLSVECTRYWSGECVASSDHKPVAAMLDLEHRYVYMCVCMCLIFVSHLIHVIGDTCMKCNICMLLCIYAFVCVWMQAGAATLVACGEPEAWLSQ